MKRTFTVFTIASLLTILGSIAYASFIDNTTQATANQNIQPTFSSSSQNYTLYYGTLGLGRSQGTTANYTLKSTMPNLPTGKHNSTNYRLYLGPCYTKTLTRNIAITSITPTKTIIGQGYSLPINITTTNKGLWGETFDITAYANTTIISQTEITLTSGNSTTVTLTWNTTGVAKRNYTITASATPLPYETTTADNTLQDGWILVTIPGDINGDRRVDIVDIYLVIMRYGQVECTPEWHSHVGCTPNGYFCDIDNTGEIDILDIYIAIKHYAQSW